MSIEVRTSVSSRVAQRAVFYMACAKPVHVPSPWRAQGPEAKGKGGFPPRFWAVYTKLAIFSLITYDKLVYLDADVLVRCRRVWSAFHLP